MQAAEPLRVIDIPLESNLRNDPTAQAELSEILLGIQREMREDNRNERLTSEQSERHHRAHVERLANFVAKAPATTAALTAKCFCIQWIPACSQDVREEFQKRELRLTARRLMEEIQTDHAGTWQSIVCALWIERLEFHADVRSAPPRERSERQRLAFPAHIARLEKVLVDVPAKLVVDDKIAMEILKLDPTVSDPVRAQAVGSLATAHYNYATCIGQTPDVQQESLKKARARFQTLVDEFPRSKHAAHYRHIISVMIDPELKRLAGAVKQP